mgnify:CR=1 FL=1
MRRPRMTKRIALDMRQAADYIARMYEDEDCDPSSRRSAVRFRRLEAWANGTLKWLNRKKHE